MCQKQAICNVDKIIFSGGGETRMTFLKFRKCSIKNSKVRKDNCYSKMSLFKNIKPKKDSPKSSCSIRINRRRDLQTQTSKTKKTMWCHWCGVDEYKVFFILSKC